MEIMKNKAHITEEGLDQIRKIKAGMNKGRDILLKRTGVPNRIINFSITILEYCDKSDLIIREQYYFNKLNPQYNILK